MANTLEVDICVIGAGAGGLAVAAGASMLGASTALVEKGTMGGDCLNFGCVPSKALLAAGHAAEGARRARALGVDAGKVTIDAGGVYGHVRRVIEGIAPNDSVARFEGMGVKVIKAPARFLGPRVVEAGGQVIKARRVVVATGSVPFVPPVPGLDQVPFHTNETIFGLNAVPEHLIIVGGGPIGIEMAQAHRHLGARVTVLEMFSILPKDDPELVDVLRARLAAEGVAVHEGISVAGVAKTENGVAVTLGLDGRETLVEGSHLLVAAGRRPGIGGLDLEKAGIAHGPQGIHVDARLRTTNRRVFAIGDVVGGYQFTHMAGHHAGIVIRNALFRLRAKVDHRAVPWVTYTSPELAQVGLTEDRAREEGLKFRVIRWPFSENDRARAEGATDGLVKALVAARGRVLGAGIVGAGAGELIQTWVLAIKEGIKIGAIADMIVP